MSASNYPAGYDSLVDPSGADPLDSLTAPHADQHADGNSAIEAIQHTLGLNVQGPFATLLARVEAATPIPGPTGATGPAGPTGPTGATGPAVAAISDVPGLTAALAGKAALASPTFTGVITVPDGAVGTPSIANAGDANTGIYFPADDEIALATAGVQRLKIDANGLLTGSGTSLGVWTTFTPSWTGLTLGTGVSNLGRYWRIGKTLFFSIQLTLGTGASATGRISIANPVAQSGFMGGTVMDGECFDASASTAYPLHTSMSGGSIYIDAIATAGTYGTKALSSATVPFTWADSDQIYVAGMYEVA